MGHSLINCNQELLYQVKVVMQQEKEKILSFEVRPEIQEEEENSCISSL